MKKVLFISILLLFLKGNIFAQFDQEISHFTFFPSAINPAMAGETGMMQIVGIQRLKHLSFEHGIVTTNFGVNTPLKISNTLHGVGLRFVINEAGSVFSNQNAYLQYAYKKKTSIGDFSLGLDIGFVSIKFDPKNVNLKDISLGDYHEAEDTKIPTSEASGMGLDLNIGALYSFKNGFVGLSLAHLNNVKVDWDQNTISLPRVLYLMGSYGFDIPDTKLVIRPQTLFFTNFLKMNWDLGGKLEYNDKIWGGLSYRIANSVVFMAGMNIVGGLSASVSYDLPTSKLIQGIGAFEVALDFNFEFLLNKQTKKYKSIRIL